jgi:hypothetical protein
MKMFISHSSSDAQFANMLAESLRAADVEVWIDTRELQPGAALVAEIQKGIANCDTLLIVLSPDSVASRWVQEEVEAAIASQATTSRPKVIPILYRDCDIPPFLKSRVWVDFRDSESDDARFGERVKTLLGQAAPPEKKEMGGSFAEVVSQEREQIELILVAAASGTKTAVSVPYDAIVDAVKDALVEILELPSKFENGRPVYYQLIHKGTSRTLSGHLTLRQNDVRNGDIVVLVIEAVAG